MAPVKLLSLADLSKVQISAVLNHAQFLKREAALWLEPKTQPHLMGAANSKNLRLPPQSLFSKTIALLFSKRSTRTRVAAESSTVLLGGHPMFLGKEDIQLGVNETLRDSARIIGGMCQGIFARVGDHSEIEELAEHSPVPVINALSSLWHPTQTLADFLTLYEHMGVAPSNQPEQSDSIWGEKKRGRGRLPTLPQLTLAYVGDSTNVLHDMLVTYPRFGHSMRIATPPNYRAPPVVMETVKRLGCDSGIYWCEDPKEAVQGADVVITDTWISMGQEHEKAQRLKDFAGYQVTEELCRGRAKDDWKFLHCLPRKQDEVDDEVFYGPRSLVFPEGDNRKWTIMALFDIVFGRWTLDAPIARALRISEEASQGRDA